MLMYEKIIFNSTLFGYTVKKHAALIKDILLDKYGLSVES